MINNAWPLSSKAWYRVKKNRENHPGGAIKFSKTHGWSSFKRVAIICREWISWVTFKIRVNKHDPVLLA
jgi:hypothetical protein